MAREITAYVSDDGAIHTSLYDAEFSDYTSLISGSVKEFLSDGDRKSEGGQSTIAINTICKWEEWKFKRYGIAASMFAPPSRASVPKIALRLEEKPKVLEPEKNFGPEVVRKPAYKKHIAVIGLLGAQCNKVEKEFLNEFKFTFIDADHALKIEGLKLAHKIVVMKKFVPHAITDKIHAMKMEPLLIRGGVTELIDALTNIYISTK
ncbi:hypothetical protein [Glaciimonas immobilis]|uniref:Uncharacterized protein n=1 Tax=Glaciimonas immobilis TaxID=728004 RepID=A0A840RW54_9BURK|nr:hypothetical protein [Glaciimonas immobilis]KAF3997525.1 hypothetical protein HAV38_12665 [Glaciimonas immobilis]MBB5200791.1 hypothetical protein [Glaciimonas immobilis]